MDVQLIADGGFLPIMLTYFSTLILGVAYIVVGVSTDTDSKSALFYLPTAGGAVMWAAVLSLLTGGGFWVAGFAGMIMAFWWAFNRLDSSLSPKVSGALGSVWLYTTAIPGAPFLASPFLATLGITLVVLVLAALI